MCAPGKAGGRAEQPEIPVELLPTGASFLSWRGRILAWV